MADAPEPEQLPISPQDAAKKLKRRRTLAIGVILCAVSAFLLFSNHGIITRVKLERKKSVLLNDLDALKSSSDSLRTTSRRLQTDTMEIERLAREKYGMIKPGEKVYIVKEKK
ncbi:MAG: septum formation initiator family protein [Candidatus Kapabacteria bacterium]|nr:septum formation initiator family protein [Candidatus Kapabacteria bacterium]